MNGVLSVLLDIFRQPSVVVALISLVGLAIQRKKAADIMKGTIRKTFIGENCGLKLLEFLPNSAIVYFHKLGFDGRLLMKYGIKDNIIKGSRIIQQTNYFKGKSII